MSPKQRTLRDTSRFPSCSWVRVSMCIFLSISECRNILLKKCILRDNISFSLFYKSRYKKYYWNAQYLCFFLFIVSSNLRASVRHGGQIRRLALIYFSVLWENLGLISFLVCVIVCSWCKLINQLWYNLVLWAIIQQSILHNLLVSEFIFLGWG